VALTFAYVVDLLYLLGREVAEAEAAEDALLVGFVNASQCLFEGHAGVWCVDIVDVELVDLDLLQRVLRVCNYIVLSASAWSKATGDLGVNGKFLTFLELADGYL